jgi:hypothetical protein
MLRYLAFILVFVFAFSCIKKKSIGPIPKIEFEDFKKIGPAGYDSAMFKLSYEDSDGDLFRDRNDEGPNLIFKTLAWNEDSGKYQTNLIFSRVVLQPADGYYKDKSIKGYIYLNEAEFRTPSKPKKLKFEVYMIDLQSNRTNVASLTHTLTE